MSTYLKARWAAHPAFHLAILAAVSAWQLVVSWRRWPDPVVDFGRELYIPWRLAEGAVLYRDVDDFYGPLSQYFNAALFRIFGPGLMVLVTANLVVFAAIVILLYFLVRRAWGPLAGLVGGAVFVTVFGFSRFVYVGNFNYATPYAHETTHGMFVLLLLAAALVRWPARPSLLHSGAVGLLFGLTLVLKAEVILAAAALIVAAGVVRLRKESCLDPSAVAVAVAGAFLPTVAFAAYFAQHVPAIDACYSAGRAWLNVFGTTRYIAEPAQLKYSGLDAPWRHLGEQAASTATALAGCGVVWLVVWIFEKRAVVKSAGLAAFAGAALATTVAWRLPQETWVECGRCLPGLIFLYLLFRLWMTLKGAPTAAADVGNGRAALFLAVLGASLMARMLLAGRIYQFGYFQAAIAAVVIAVVMTTELPAWAAATRAGRIWGTVCALGILLPGVIRLMEKSRSVHAMVNSPMGAGADRFFTFKPSEGLAAISNVLEKQPRRSTLLVLPEGLMLNYLARMPSPAPHFFYYSAVTEHGNEARIVEKIAATPPDFVVMLPRDLTEYGIRKYGERSGAGGDLLAWMQGRYELFGWLREGAAEADPPVDLVAYRGNYFQIYRRKR